MANYSVWNVQSRHEWLAKPLKKKRVKRRAANRIGLLDALERKGLLSDTAAEEETAKADDSETADAKAEAKEPAKAKAKAKKEKAEAKAEPAEAKAEPAEAKAEPAEAKAEPAEATD